jgi:NhaP-type Na+/H+ or K+/H+ antiporter
MTPPENNDAPTSKFKAALIVVALTIVFVSLKVVTSKAVWSGQSWNTWKYQITTGIIGVVAILTAMYFRWPPTQIKNGTLVNINH